jgi:hypothetical protein
LQKKKVVAAAMAVAVLVVVATAIYLPTLSVTQTIQC